MSFGAIGMNLGEALLALMAFLFLVVLIYISLALKTYLDRGVNFQDTNIKNSQTIIARQQSQLGVFADGLIETLNRDRLDHIGVLVEISKTLVDLRDSIKAQEEAIKSTRIILDGLKNRLDNAFDETKAQHFVCEQLEQEH